MEWRTSRRSVFGGCGTVPLDKIMSIGFKVDVSHLPYRITLTSLKENRTCKRLSSDSEPQWILRQLTLGFVPAAIWLMRVLKGPGMLFNDSLVALESRPTVVILVPYSGI